jgi:hypothetical protein
MKMKHLVPAIAVLLCTGSITAQASGLSNREIREQAATMSPAEKDTRAEEIKLRVEEIKHTDKFKLSGAERRAMKEEMKMMRKEAKAMGGGGVYISLAGILIIILLLIILL